MATFLELYSEVIGTVPHIPPPLAQKFVNRAFGNISEARLWSWLVATGDLNVPESIHAGTVTVTKGSPIVTLDASALAAVLPEALATPPVASPVLGVGRQFRVCGQPLSGPIYSIAGFSSENSTLLLDRVYAETSATNANYQIYKCYYAPPTADFLRYISLTNVASGYTIRDKRLYQTQAHLNTIDAQRSTAGDAYQIAMFKPTNDGTGQPVHELYPHPVSLSVYNAIYRRQYIPLTTSQDLPTSIPDYLVLSRALVYAANWAMVNITTYPELAQINWANAAQNYMAAYRADLIQAIKRDDEISPLLGHTLTHRTPLSDIPGGEFLQSHDISILLTGNY